MFLTPFYQAEVNIAKKILDIVSHKSNKKISNLKKELEKQEIEFGIVLSEKQKEAIHAVNEHNICVITGGPGTGKTTIIKNIIELYEARKKKVILCAPTGRAAKRMSEQTGREAKTIHRLLEIGKLAEEEKIANVDYPIAPIDADVVIIDEMSMVDVFLMNYIVKGLYNETKVVLVGDVDQLPSVGPGNVLKDIIHAEVVETIYLDEIFRQAAKSNIVVNAHRVNHGEPFWDNLGEDFFYIKKKSQEEMLDEIISLCKGRLKTYGDYDFLGNIQILTPTKKGLLGTKELNQSLQKEFNPEEYAKKEKRYGEQIFRMQDRVMQIKNNYDIFWEKEHEAGSGIFNGEMGTIAEFDEENKVIKILFDDEKLGWYEYSNLDQIEHSYAITIHKSQRK